MKLHEQIKAARLRQNKSLHGLAKEMGWKYQLLQRIEKDGKCSVRSLQAISNALHQAFYIMPENIIK